MASRTCCLAMLPSDTTGELPRSTGFPVPSFQDSGDMLGSPRNIQRTSIHEHQDDGLPGGRHGFQQFLLMVG